MKMKCLLLSAFLILTSMSVSAYTGPDNNMMPMVILDQVHISDDYKKIIAESTLISMKISESSNSKRVSTLNNDEIVYFRYGIYIDGEAFYLSHHYDDVNLMMKKILELKYS